MGKRKPIRSDMAWSTTDRIVVCGLDLPNEILGKVSLGDMAWLEIKGSLPDARQSAVFNAMLVTLVEHGMTPMAVATRLTYLGAPESLQAAVAAGLCGMGTTYAGTAEGAARWLQEALRVPGAIDKLEEVAERVVSDHLEKKRPIHGLGHTLHKPIDPRTPRLFSIAEENGFSGAYVRLLQLVSRAAETATGKSLPVNATGAIGALACELDIDWRLCRGIAVIGRAIGLVGHIAEELRNPIARQILDRIVEETTAHRRPG